MKKTAILLAILMAIGAGCYKQRIVVGQGANTNNSPASEEWAFFFIEGLIGKKTTNVQQICGGQDAVVEIETSCIDSLVAGFTSFLITPQSVRVYCGGNRKAMSEQDVEKLLAETDLQERIEKKVLEQEPKQGF